MGLGARDTLRLEAALRLYGNDIDETTDPWEAGPRLDRQARQAGDFLGQGSARRAQAARADAQARRHRDGRPRHRAPRLPGGRSDAATGNVIGQVTSGSPCAYARPEHRPRLRPGRACSARRQPRSLSTSAARPSRPRSSRCLSTSAPRFPATIPICARRRTATPSPPERDTP